MTFKHVKFEDSSTMRSLVKVAQEKGWTKEEPLKKTAAVTKTADLRPTDNLMDNILRLCAGLRERGFQKYAEELENNLFTYKQADTMYDVSKEKGEDLLEHAHPQGSHKMEDVDSTEAVFEDLIEKHTKTMKAVDKNPTGKLSDASAVLGAVKRVLAQGADSGQLEQSITRNVQRAVQVVEQVGPIIQSEMTIYTDYVRKLDSIKQASLNPTIDNLQVMVDEIGYLKSRIKPSNWTTLWMGGITENTWATVEPMLDGATRLVNNAIQARKSINAQRAAAITKSFEDGGAGEGGGSGTLQVPEQQVAADPLIGKGVSLINRLKGLQALRNVAQNTEALQWTKDEIGEIQDVIKRFNQAVSVGQGDSVRSDLEAEMNTKESEVNDFYKQVHQGA
jgi:hypothetical protein